jgi:hypothetical protein
MNKPEEAPEEVKIVADPTFEIISPHGLSIWTNPKTGKFAFSTLNFSSHSGLLG